MQKNFIFFLLFFTTAYGQNGVFKLDTLPEGTRGIKAMIKGNWKYHAGDDPRWASTTFNDSSWSGIPSNFNLNKIKPVLFDHIGWFRMRVIVDTSFVNKTIALLLAQAGASEIFLDGKLLYRFGKIDIENPDNEQRYDPTSLPVDIRFENVRHHLIAVRYANARALEDIKENENDVAGFIIKFAKLRESIENRYVDSNVITCVFIFYFTFFLALSFLHMLLFLFYRTNKSNLFYAIFNLAFGMMFIWLLGQQNLLYPDAVAKLQTMGKYLPNIYGPALLAMLYIIFYKKMPKIFWLWLALFSIDFITSVAGWESRILGFVIYIILIAESLRVIVASIFKKREGAWIIGLGVITTLIFFTAFTIITVTNGDLNFEEKGWMGLLVGLLVILATLSIPISMSIYLARDFAKTNKDLEKKLMEVEELSAKTIEQEKEKQIILSNQNTLLEKQVQERTKEIVEQKKVIEEKQKELLDSIKYAKRIQTALLPTEKYIHRKLAEANPKNKGK